MDDLDPGTDPQLRAELLAARAWGVSHKRFCGWEPRTVTTYEYDEGGRLVRSVTVTEREWDDDQRELAYGLARWEASLCPGCGGDLAETTDPSAEYAWRRTGPQRCYRCQMLEMYQEAEAKAQTAQPQSLLYQLERKPEEPDDASGR